MGYPEIITNNNFMIQGKVRAEPDMNTIQHDRSQISRTGPADHGTGPRSGNNLGPVPDQ